MDGTTKAFTNFMNGLKGGVDLPAFNESDLPEVQAAFFSQFLLGQAQFEAEFPNVTSENF